MSFWFCNTSSLLESLQRLDREMAGHTLLDEDVVGVGEKNRYLVNSLMEESIRSSQLQGTNTTHLVAQEMLRTGRRSRDQSEQMIFNNFAAMQKVERWARDGRSVTEQRLLDLHETVTCGTLRDPADSGRLHTAGEVRVAVVSGDGSVVHTPPLALELPERMVRPCAFANGELDDVYLHPMIRAVMCHFMIGYDHLFVDGNGRTARALFYWSLLRSGYWLASYLSISSLLRAAPSKSTRAPMSTSMRTRTMPRTFLLHQLGVIERAVDQLQDYIGRQVERASMISQVLKHIQGLNHRQETIMERALHLPLTELTVDGHQVEFRVSYGSVRADLIDLVKRGLFVCQRVGRKYIFYAVSDLQERLGR